MMLNLHQHQHQHLHLHQHQHLNLNRTGPNSCMSCLTKGNRRMGSVENDLRQSEPSERSCRLFPLGQPWIVAEKKIITSSHSRPVLSCPVVLVYPIISHPVLLCPVLSCLVLSVDLSVALLVYPLHFLFLSVPSSACLLPPHLHPHHPIHPQDIRSFLPVRTASIKSGTAGQRTVALRLVSCVSRSTQPCELDARLDSQRSGSSRFAIARGSLDEPIGVAAAHHPPSHTYTQPGSIFLLPSPFGFPTGLMERGIDRADVR